MEQRVTVQAIKVGKDISLDIDECDAEGFRNFIENFKNGTFGVFGTLFCTRRGKKPFLRDPLKTGILNYFDVLFLAGSANVSLECRYLECDLYLIAIRPMNSTKWYAFSNWIDTNTYNVLDLDMDFLSPMLGGDYPTLERGQKTRLTNHLGRESLYNSVVQLGRYKSGQGSNLYLKPFLLTVIEMTSEAIRFPRLLNSICDMFYSGAPLSHVLVGLTNDFKKECKRFTSRAIREKIDDARMSRDQFNGVGVLMELQSVEYDETPEGFFVADQHCQLSIAEKMGL